MKILFINLPYFGHVIPTIGLVQELIKEGCEVTYILPYDWEKRVQNSGAKFHGYKNHKQLAEQMKYAFNEAKTIIEDYDLVIYEQFFFIGKHLAQIYHKPSVRIFTAPVTNRKLMDEYIHSKGPLHIFQNKWICKAFTKDITKGIVLKTDNWLDEIIYNPPGLNLVYTLRAYQPYQEDFSDALYKFLGPSIYDRDEVLNYQKTNRPLIYISLGTVVSQGKHFFQDCIEAFRNEDVDVLMSVGSQFKIHQLKNVPSHIHVYPYVAQIEVLKQADVFVTHGGMNSINEAFTYGVKTVVIPFSSDQPINATTVERMNIGKRLDFKQTNSTTIHDVVMEVLENREMEDHLKSLQALIQKAPGNKGGAKMIIEYYTNETF